MNNSKKKMVNLAFIVFLLLCGMSVSTQYFASYFNYASNLGSNYNHLYFPWQIFKWYLSFKNNYGNDFNKAFSLGSMVVVVGFMILLVINIIMNNTAKANKSMHGSAKWAEHKDIQSAGLFPTKDTTHSVVVGAWEDKKGNLHYLMHSGPEHILTYAPTRSGKGVGLVLPSLLMWVDSCVITDLKGELWQLTSGWRKKYANNKVLKFEPASLSSICWNPLDEIRIGTEYEIGDVQNLATLIVDPDGKGLSDHWQKTCYALLVGCILHSLYKAKNEGSEASLAAVDRMLADPDRPTTELWNEMVTYHHFQSDGRMEVHRAVASTGRDMLDRPEEEGGSVLSSAKSYLSLYRDDIVARNTKKSDFRIKDLMNYDSAVSLYIVTQPNDKSRLRPLVRILINMIIRLLADKMEFENGMPKKTYKHKLLAMLDEFPSLGKLEILQESLAFVAGYGIKCYLICQDINQLKSRETGYGADETITSNCHIQNAYPPNRIETAEHLSKLTGTTTIIKESITTSGKRVSVLLGQVSRTIQEVQRPLLTPDECLRMKGPDKDSEGKITSPGDMVVYVAGKPAIYGKQPLYFKDEVFLLRSQVSAPIKTDVIRSINEVIL